MALLNEASKSFFRFFTKLLIRIWVIAIVIFAICAAISAVILVFNIEFDFGFYYLIDLIFNSPIFLWLFLFSIAFPLLGLLLGAFVFSPSSETQEEADGLEGEDDDLEFD